MHFVAEQARTFSVGRERLVREPVVGPPDDPAPDIVGEPLDEPLPAEGHLRLILGADEHLESRLPDDAGDRLPQRRVVVLPQRFVSGVLDRIERPLLVGDRPVGRVPQPGNAAEKPLRFETVGREEGVGPGVVAKIGAEGTVGAEVHHRAPAAECAGQRERGSVAEINEFSLAEQVDRAGQCLIGRGRRGGRGGPRQRDAVDTERLAGRVTPAGQVLLGDERGPGAVEQEVAVGEGRVDRGRIGRDPEPGKPATKHRLDSTRDTARPERDLDLGQFPLQRCEQTRRVGDVADVDRLPARPQQDPFRPLCGSRSASSGRQKRQAGCLYRSAAGCAGWGRSPG